MFYWPAREGPEAVCPDCGSHKYLHRLAIIHLLVHAPDDGLIPGSNLGAFWAAGKYNRYTPLCERGQALLRKHQETRGPDSWPEWFKMTTLPDAASCNECKEILAEFERTGVAKDGLWLPVAADELE